MQLPHANFPKGPQFFVYLTSPVRMQPYNLRRRWSARKHITKSFPTSRCRFNIDAITVTLWKFPFSSFLRGHGWPPMCLLITQHVQFTVTLWMLVFPFPGSLSFGSRAPAVHPPFKDESPAWGVSVVPLMPVSHSSPHQVL